MSQNLAQRARSAALWLRDSALGVFGFALVLTVALAGWAASFIGLHDFGIRHMDLAATAAWLVPITFDGAPAGLSIVVARASVHGRSAPLWRFLIVAFTALSSWINWQHIDDPLGRIVASLMPPAAVVLFEGLMSEARAAAIRRMGRAAPRLHPLRWAFDFTGTKAIYRAYVLGLELPEQLRAAAEQPVSVAPERPAERPEQPPVSAPTTPPVSARDERPAERAQKPKSERRTERLTKPKTSAPASVLTQRRERARRLYDELGKRPEWTEIRDALVAEKLAPKTISRPTIQRIRDAIEANEPHLAALGSDNVRALTG